MNHPPKFQKIINASIAGLLAVDTGWTENPNYPDYLVGIKGSVLSLRGKIAKILKANSNTIYPAYSLRNRDGILKTVTLHTLVATTYISPRPEGMECCHNDGNKQNGYVCNLRWDTPVNNNRDKVAHGTHRQGEKVNFAKLNREAVIIIRQLWRDGVSRTKIARKFRMSPTNIRLVATGRSWAHITEGLE